jgi:hypothetical protein
MEQIPTPKKERKFLKAIVRVAGVLVQELALGLGRKYIGKMINKIKIPKKRETLSFLLLLCCTFAFAQYPATGNKQRLGYQTTGDGLVFRGRSNDTTALKPSSLNNAYHLFDTVNNVLFSYIKTKGGWKFNNSDTVIIQGVTMPFDSITFNTAKDGTVGVGEVEYNDTQGSLIQGLKGGNVTNVIGQQLHQRVNNRTGSTLAKGTAVYLSGSQGNRITVAKALGVSDAFSANTFGIVAESIADNQSGYVITEGLIKNINTSALVEDSAVYLSPTVAGGLTSTKPQAPQHTVYIGVCVKSNAGSGELFVKIFNGQELEELHNVRITNPSNNASLYYKLNEKLWRDTTAVLLVSDTASMLTNYLRTGVAASTYTPLTRSISTTAPLQGGGDLSANRTFSITQASGSVNGFLSSTDWTTFNGKQNALGFTPANSIISISTTSPLSGGGNLTANRTLSITQSSGSVNGYLSSTDWTTFNSKQNAITLTTTGTSGAATLVGATLNIPQYSGGSGTVTNITVTAPLTITNPSTTPLIQITAANGTSTSGVVTTTSQQFGGAKTFNDNLTTNGNMQVDGTLNVGSSGTFSGRLNTPWLERTYVNSTATSLTVSAGITWLNIHQDANVTLTLPNAATYPGKELIIKQTGAGTVFSASSNVIEFATSYLGSPQNVIINPTLYRFTTLVSDGTYWIKMQRN